MRITVMCLFTEQKKIKIILTTIDEVREEVLENMNGIEPQSQLFNKICTITGFVQINYQLS